MNVTQTPIEVPEGADQRIVQLVNDANDANALQLANLRREWAQRGATRQWTPTLSFATPGDLSVSYSAQVGEYRILQRCIKLWARLTCTPTFTTSSGNLFIEGIPLAVSSTDSNYRSVGAITWGGITLGAGYTQVNVQAASGLSVLLLVASGSGKSLANVTASNVTSGGTINFQFEIEYRF